MIASAPMAANHRTISLFSVFVLLSYNITARTIPCPARVLSHNIPAKYYFFNFFFAKILDFVWFVCVAIEVYKSSHSVTAQPLHNP